MTNYTVNESVGTLNVSVIVFNLPHDLDIFTDIHLVIQTVYETASKNVVIDVFLWIVNNLKLKFCIL